MPGHGTFPRAHEKAGHRLLPGQWLWFRPNDTAFPKRGRATSSGPHKGHPCSTCPEPGFVWNVQSGQGFSVSALSAPWAGEFFITGGYLAHYCMFRRNSGLNPLDARSALPTPPNCKNPNCLQTEPNVPWGQKCLLLRPAEWGPPVVLPGFALLLGRQVSAL